MRKGRMEDQVTERQLLGFFVVMYIYMNIVENI